MPLQSMGGGKSKAAISKVRLCILLRLSALEIMVANDLKSCAVSCMLEVAPGLTHFMRKSFRRLLYKMSDGIVGACRKSHGRHSRRQSRRPGG